MNPSWISAIVAILTVVAHLWLYAVNRACEKRMQGLESRMVREIQDVKDWVYARFVTKSDRGGSSLAIGTIG
jgi:hypothetical protein